MESGDSEKTKGSRTAKITAAHLAGLRPRPTPDSPLGKWDLSTAFVAGFALAILVLPEVTALFGFGAEVGAPHSALDLLVLLGFIALFGIFPVVVLQHLYLQTYCKNPTRFDRAASALLALALMFFATSAMKPLVGYDQKIAENARELKSVGPLVGEVSRAPASAPVESIRQGTDLFR